MPIRILILGDNFLQRLIELASEDSFRLHEKLCIKMHGEGRAMLQGKGEEVLVA
jgi:regulator of sigma D